LKSLSRLTLVIIVLVAAFSAFLLLFFIRRNQPERLSIKSTLNALATPNSEQASSALPVRLKIPSINVDAAVEYVGLTQDGRVDVPKGPSGVAWFELGPIPGETGSAVVDGHSGWKNGVPAAFDNLYKMQIGDKIYVENQSGTEITFVTREIRSYDKNEAVSDVFNSNDAQAHLNLITCAGDWNAREKTHSKRLVVFADKAIK
jgi:LPXTG-site transpeptidase (sortase) family protein